MNYELFNKKQQIINDNLSFNYNFDINVSSLLPRYRVWLQLQVQVHKFRNSVSVS